LPGNAIEQQPEFKAREKLNALQVERFNGADQLFVNAEDKGHGSPGNAGNNIRSPHAESLQGQYHVIEKRPFFRIGLHLSIAVLDLETALSGFNIPVSRIQMGFQKALSQKEYHRPLPWPNICGLGHMLNGSLQARWKTAYIFGHPLQKEYMTP
jgi:hypothetical protein